MVGKQGMNDQIVSKYGVNKPTMKNQKSKHAQKLVRLRS